jgi:hypothetical protein
MSHRLALLIPILLPLWGCGGKAVIDPTRDAGSSATGDPNCLALCDHETFACTSNSSTSGGLSKQADAPHGCVWAFTASGQAPITATMDCEAYCMLEDGQCYLLNWAAPGDTVVSALGFATSSDVWACSASSP